MRSPFEPQNKFCGEEVMAMAKNAKQTGSKAASAAGKILSSPKATPAQKKVAASDLAQTPSRTPKKK
jgi:hypothetical protein